jgi:predicted dehydrogenase
MRVLVVGHGLIGRQRAAALGELGQERDVRLAGTVDPMARAPELYGGAPHFGSLASVSTDAYDAAVIALPHDVAKDPALHVLRHGKPVLLEKPLGRTAREAQELADAAQGARLPSFVGHNYRFLPHVREAFACAGRGELGRLRSIDVLLGHGGHPGSAQGWKLDLVRAGGGVLLDPGVHLFDLVFLLAPGAQLEHVAATRGFWTTGIEEEAVAIFSEARLLATVRVSLIRWVNTFRIEIGGEDGYALVEGRGGNYGPLRLTSGRRWGWSDGSGRSQRQTEDVLEFGDRDASLRDELAAVLAAWSGETAPAPGPASFEDALRVARLCDTMYETLAARAPKSHDA